jgi:hypothetical protein
MHMNHSQKPAQLEVEFPAGYSWYPAAIFSTQRGCMSGADGMSQYAHHDIVLTTVNPLPQIGRRMITTGPCCALRSISGFCSGVCYSLFLFLPFDQLDHFFSATFHRSGVLFSLLLSLFSASEPFGSSRVFLGSCSMCDHAGIHGQALISADPSSRDCST